LCDYQAEDYSQFGEVRMFHFAQRSQKTSSIYAAILAVFLFAAMPLAHSQSSCKPMKTAPTASQASSNLLDINTATAAELKALPGVGDAYSQRIIAGRPYTAKNQLVQRGILPKATYDKISAQIIAHRPK
jgi:DNA uptake protein ComE-like DNA-binding protein